MKSIIISVSTERFDLNFSVSLLWHLTGLLDYGYNSAGFIIYYARAEKGAVMKNPSPVFENRIANIQTYQQYDAHLIIGCPFSRHVDDILFNWNSIIVYSIIILQLPFICVFTFLLSVSSPISCPFLRMNHHPYMGNPYM